MSGEKCEREMRGEVVFVSCTDAASRIRRAFSILINATFDCDSQPTGVNLDGPASAEKSGCDDEDTSKGVS